MKCPHEHIKDCPLYVLAHKADWSQYGCVVYLPDHMECAVERGEMDYQATWEQAVSTAFEAARQRLGLECRA